MDGSEREIEAKLREGFIAVKTSEQAEAILQELEAAGTKTSVVEGRNAGSAGGSRPAATVGRTLLRQALIKRLRPMDAIDTIFFVQVNNLPHPPRLDRALARLSWLFTGGHGWLAVLGLCFLGRRKISGASFLRLLPAIWLSAYLVEGPIKRVFRRRRPFVGIVRAIVVGRKPGNYSFPSGHSAAAFAGAAVFAREFPRGRSWFYGLASLISASRVYLGAHYPGDVLIGGLLGGVLARMIQGVSRWVLRRR